MLSFFFGVPLFFHLFFCLASFGFTTEYLQDLILLPGVILLYNAFYTWHVFIRSTSRVLLPMLLLLCTGVVAAAAVAVRRRVPDGNNCFWFIESDSLQCFFFFF